MLEACLREGKTFQRGEVEHLTSEGEIRHLGVTISPIYRGMRSATTAQGRGSFAFRPFRLRSRPEQTARCA